MTMKYKESLIDYNPVSYVNEDTEIITEDKTDIMDCALGTNPFGHTKLLDAAGPELLKNIHLYPDYPYVELKDEIIRNWSEVASLSHKNIHISNGSITILERINRVFMDPGSKALGCCPQFTDYSCDVKAMGGVFDYVLLKEANNYKYDVNEIINAIKPEYKIIYLDNPNNPTGQVLPIEDIRLILKEAAKLDICVIIDEAYADFISREESAISLIGEFDNLIVTRSFSKGLGLAGMRLGYLVAGEEFCKYYSKANSPFPISNMAAAMAKIAISDRGFIEESIKKITEYKKTIIGSLTKIKVAETDERVPIMLLICDDPKVNLFNLFYKNKVATEKGADFTGLSTNSIRFKVPKDCARVMGLIKEIEKSL